MDAEAKKLFAGDTWAISGDRREVEDQSITYPIQRANGFQEDYSENANPDREIFNQILCEVVSACKETLHGISPWDKDVTYPADSYTQVNGALYHALARNTGVNPVDVNQTKWYLIGDRLSQVATAPDAIVGANVFIDSSRADNIRVYWHPPNNGGRNITNTELSYSKAADFSNGVTTIQNYMQGNDINITERDSDLYYIRLRFENSVGFSAHSPALRVRNTPLIPAAIPGFTATSGAVSGRVDLSWNDASTANGLTISKYRVEWKSGSETFSNSASPARHQETTSTSINITGLTDGTTYTFRIIPVSNRNTENAGTATQSIAPEPGSRIPSQPTISLTGGVGHIIAVATDIPPNNGAAITSYKWQYKLSSAATWTDAANTIPPITTISSLTAGDYNVRMRATNSVGDGPWSTAVNVTVTQHSAPSNIVIEVISTNAGETIGIVPVLINDGGSAISGFQWAYKLATASTWTTLSQSNNAMSQTFASLTSGTTYNFRLTVTNGVGSTTSSQFTHTTP